MVLICKLYYSISIAILSLLISCFFVCTVDGQGSVPWPVETDLEPFTPAVVPSESLAQLRMNGATTTAANKTVCTRFIFNKDEDFHIIGFTGKTTHIVHHLALYGCVAAPDPSQPCSCPLNRRRPLFSSVHNTPKIRFTGTGTKTSGGFRIQARTTFNADTYNRFFLLLEVHYHDTVTIPDFNTGVDLNITRSITPTYILNIVTMLQKGTILPNTDITLMDSCLYPGINVLSDSSKIHLVAMQAHTHQMGRLVSLYHTKGTDRNEFYRANPQWPQSYNPISSSPFQLSRSQSLLYLRCYFTSIGVDFPVNTNGVPGTKTQWEEMCIANLILAVPTSWTVTTGNGNSYRSGACTDAQKATINSFGTSTTLFGPNPKLDLAAAYGNQTGTVSIDSTHSMNLDMETFTGHFG